MRPQPTSVLNAQLQHSSGFRTNQQSGRDLQLQGPIVARFDVSEKIMWVEAQLGHKVSKVVANFHLSEPCRIISQDLAAARELIRRQVSHGLLFLQISLIQV